MSRRTAPPSVARAQAERLQARTVLEVLQRQGRPGERGEDVLLDRGLLDERELAVELALRSGRQFVGLRGFLPDARLFLYVPLATAVAQRVCPLVLVGDSLKVASAYLDPDLDGVRERFPQLDVELVVATRGDVLAALHLVSTT